MPSNNPANNQQNQNSTKRINKKMIKDITTLALLVAVIVVLQAIAPVIKLPVNVSFALVPITIGAILLGPGGGAILGAVFGLMTIINGLIGADGFTAALLNISPVWTVILCMAKATLAGLFAGLIYKPIRKKSVIGATFTASAIAPVVNTGIFLLGGFTVLSDAVIKAGGLEASGTSLVYFLVIVCAGINFIAELLVNLLFATAIKTIVEAVQKATSKK